MSDFNFFSFTLKRLSLSILLIASCAKDDLSLATNDILAIVGDRIITSKDFLQRSEYTIRPDYCKGDLYQHKKIILNNLIAEKLLAIEIEESGVETINTGASAFLKGRKEQSMRQLLYFKEGYSKSTITDEEIARYFKMAGRTYEISHFSFPGGAFLDSVNSALKANISFDDIYRSNFDNNIPTRSVQWEDSNHPLVDDILFNQPVSKNQVIGPLLIEDGSFVIMKINGWTDRMAMTDRAVQERHENVVNTLKERRGVEIYKKFIANVMRGKEVVFNREVLITYADAISDRYFRSKEEKESAISSALFNSDDFLTLEDIKPMSDEFSGLSLFKLNGKEWKIRDFEDEIMSHPLVFRKKKMNIGEFTDQFRLAIIDFIQDKYLTEKAYELSLDTSFEVVQSANLWKDSFLAYQSSLLLQQNESNEKRYILMKPIIDKLQEKYDKSIFINTDLFEKIKISKVDMFVTQNNVPYPVVVPNFPSYTDDSYLNYGSKLETGF